MYQHCKYLIIACLLGISPISVFAEVQDSIPPVFTTLPSNITVSCEVDPIPMFTEWFTTTAGAIADNGTANVFTTISLSIALDTLQIVQALNCRGDGVININFFALDSCGLQSEIKQAQFIIEDNTPPEITFDGEDLSVPCDSMTTESLQGWLDNRLGAIATDNCSDSIVWLNYTWEDDAGISGFAQDQDTTNIIVSRDNCLWAVTVTYFLEDGCGNINTTSATFSISEDTISPTIVFMPNDTTLTCDGVAKDTFPTIVDACDGVLTNLTVRDSTNRSQDSLSCDFHNYNLFRIWTTEDRCGNTISTTQTITFADTIPPEIIGENPIALDCDVNLDDNNLFISVIDDCSAVTTTFQDSTIFTSDCQLQLERTWTATDICGNTENLVQTVQIQDFTGPQFVSIPRDTIVSCMNNNLEEVFREWLDSFGGATVEDNCQNFSVRGLPPRMYSDTIEISEAEAPILQQVNCTNVLGPISTQQVSFVAFDRCNNITQREALFSIIDPINPTITFCPPDNEIPIAVDRCSAPFDIELPVFEDNCLTERDARWQLTINGSIITESAQDGSSIALDIGSNRLEYLITDCGGNSAECVQNIQVRDDIPPVFTCPEDKIIYFTQDDCNVSFQPEPISEFSDNCPIQTQFQETRPNGLGLLSFTFNNTENIFQASDNIINFENFTLIENIATPRLIVEYFADLSSGSEIILQDESGAILSVIDNADCSVRNMPIDISLEQLSEWAEDGNISIVIVHRSNGGTGTQPCEPEAVPTPQGNDGVSFLRITLSYALLTPEITLTNTETDSSRIISDFTTLDI